MTGAPRRPFRSRLLYVILGAIGLIAASLMVALYNERQYDRQVAEAAQVQARVLAATASAALSFGDRSALQDYVDAVRANADVDAVGVFDEHGRLAASFTRSRLAQTLAETLRPENARGQVIVLAPVVQRGTRLGVVYLRSRKEPLLRRLGHYMGAGLLVAMASLMFLIMALDSRALRRANAELITLMAEREKAEAALRQSQKMEAVGRLTGGIAHDFNNMLGVVLGSVDLLLRRYLDDDPNARRLAQSALDGARRAAALTKRLLAFSRQQPLKPASVDVAKCVSDMSELLRRTLGDTVVVEAVAGAGLWRAHIDLPQLESAILNLAINARDAMPAGGKLTLESSNVYLDRAYAADDPEVTPGQYVMLAVTDSGSGIPPEVLGKVFEPFFTTKPPGHGTGLGLSQVHGFIRQSGGHVRIYSEVEVGTTIKLYLPRSTAEPEPARSAVASPSTANGRREKTVLLVEDEDGMRAFAQEALTELGYDVIAAPGAQAALELLDSHDDVSVLLTDVAMPQMNGRGLAEQALERAPQLRVVFMTGYTRDAIVHNGVLDVDARLVSKPFTVAELGAELEAALAAPASGVAR